VLKDDVGNLVGHRSGELGFVGGRLYGSKIDEDGPAWQGEGVDIGNVHDMEIVGPVVAGSLGREFLAERLNVLSDWAGIGQDGHLLVDLLHDFVSEFDLLLRRHVVFAWL
jgi:hypothetical protein